MNEFSDVTEVDPGWMSFRQVLKHLLLRTVRVHTNESSFTGRLTSVATSYITLVNKSGGPGSHVNVVYIPVRHINAIGDR